MLLVIKSSKISVAIIATFHIICFILPWRSRSLNELTVDTIWCYLNNIYLVFVQSQDYIKYFGDNGLRLERRVNVKPGGEKSGA